MLEIFIKRSLVTLFLCMFLLFVPSIGVAREYTFVSLEYLPYSIYEDGVPVGSDIEILEECFRRMNIDVNILLLPWKRALQMAMLGHVDGIFGAVKIPERMEKMYYSDPVRVEQISLFVRQDSKLDFNGDLEKLQNLSFGVIRDFSYGSKFDEFLAEASKTGRVERVVDTEMNLAKLIKGRFNILVGDHFSTLHTIRNEGLKGKVRSLDPPVAENNIYITFSKKRRLAYLRDRFNVALKSVRADGTWERIMKKYVD
ncbi:ABC transporter substrate-binding protein [Desulfovibrio sp. JC022]|uniref:substrate-binding periplasmic protein n=1 Tax=Desulfovibrio sp. JC022 TaxID=2593642 RepID=UPI001D1E294D|nr:transporter substrate-binding domain-containing protein [Desulfovibrio sp. JC022]NDV21874.1 transporter substrate-binding domain-containing protein [Desulfovibrio sp. JC022]